MPSSDQLQICTLNVRSIGTQLRLREFDHVFSSNNPLFDVIGLSETRRSAQECLDFANGYVLYSSGSPTAQAACAAQGGHSTVRPKAGVGFYLSTEVNKRVSNVKYISDRIIQLILDIGGRRKMRLTQVYAPHSGYDDFEYDDFLHLLAGAIGKKSLVYDIILGDFNAIIGSRQPQDTCCGAFGSGTRNTRGEALVNFCESEGFYISNTWFKKRKSRRWTWKSPAGNATNEIDFFLTRKRTSITDVSVLAKLNFSSDHRLVRATMNIACVKRSVSARSRSLPAIFSRDQLVSEMIARAHDIPQDASFTTYIDAMKQVQQASERRQTPLPRISDRTRRFFIERRRLIPPLSASPTKLLQYSIVCKAVRWSLSEDIRSHHIAVLERAIMVNRLRHGRAELAYARRQLNQVRKPDGSLTESIAETAQQAASFYSSLYSSNEAPTIIDPRSPTVPILPEELIYACSKIRGNTAPGIDGVPSKVAKHCVPVVANKIAELLNLMFNDNNFPTEFAHARTILLFKKGDPFDLGNYRPISLLSTTYKCLTRVITNKLFEVIADRLPVEQAGFRKGFSTVSHILTLNLLVEKTREWDLPLHMVFIDFCKAFDTVEHSAIWAALDNFGVDAALIRMIQQLYLAGSASLDIGQLSVPFLTQRGVRQGDSLSPLLFILTLQSALNRINWGDRGIDVNGSRLRYLAYADDVVLIAESVNDLQSMLNETIVECKRVGLEINPSKTKWVSQNSRTFSVNTSPLLEAGDNKVIERVEQFVYLGHRISIPRDHNREVGRRISASWAAFNKARLLLTNKNTPMFMKKRYFIQVITPALLYASEVWALTKYAEERLTRFQRAVERRFLNIRLQDRKSSAWIRGKTKLKDVVGIYRARKWDHAAKVLSKLPDLRWDSKLLMWTPTGTRPMGRPRTRYADDFTKVVGRQQDWKQIAQTSEWKRMKTTFVTFLR